MCKYIEKGKCDICGKEANIKRKYYYYNIECDCHSPKHFEIVYHCKDCVPRPPYETKAVFSKDRLKPMEE